MDRRRYQDGGFNGQWTSQLAPSQCSGTLFPPSNLSSSLQLLHPFSISLHLSLCLSFSLFPFFSGCSFVRLSSCVSLVCFLSSSRSPTANLIPLIVCFSLFLHVSSSPSQNSRSICDLEGFRTEAGHYGPLSRPRTREHRKPGSYLIRGEVYSPVDSNWARNHRALLFSVRTLKKTLTNSRFLAYYCRTAPPLPLPLPSLLSSPCETSPLPLLPF